MKSYPELKAEAQKLQDLAASIKADAAAQADAIDKIQNDKTRSQSWKLAQIAAVRSASRIDDKLKELRTRHDAFMPEKDLWVNPYFALARARILPGEDGATEANEAAIRANFRDELSRMLPVAARLIVAEYAMRRDWARVFQGALVLGVDNLPFALDSLPIPSVDSAQELFYQVEYAFRDAVINAEELRGIKSGNAMTAMGLLTMEYERQKAQRQRGWTLTLDERKKFGMDKPAGLADMLNPKPMNITLPVGVPDAGFKREKSFEPIQPGEIPE